MRDILFRAKRLDAGGAWAEGYFVSSGNGTNEIIPKDSYWDYYEGFSPEYEVDPDTLGQYTGLNDMNGQKIFEGDIVLWHSQVYPICWIDKYARFAAKPKGAVFAVIPFDQGEVVGNIYDNPELLVGVANG